VIVLAFFLGVMGVNCHSDELEVVALHQLSNWLAKPVVLGDVELAH